MNRVDKLGKAYTHLSLEERAELLGRTGLSSRSIATRVVSVEDITNEALHSEFLQEPGTEFLFYYQRPEWILKAKEGLEFQFKMLFQNLFNIQIGYEPEKLIQFTKAFYTLESYRLLPKPSESLQLDYLSQEKFEYLDEQNIVFYSRLARWSLNGEEELQDFFAAARFLREEVCISDEWKEFYETNDKVLEDCIHSTCLIGVPSHMKLALDRLLNEIMVMVIHQDTEVPDKQYQSLPKMTPVFVRPRAAHRPRKKQIEAGEDSDAFVQQVIKRHPLALLMLRSYKKREDDNWQQMLEASNTFKQLSKDCDTKIIEEIFALIPSRIENANYALSPNTYNKIKSPLAFAGEIAARELRINCDSPLTLIGMFEDAGGKIKPRKSEQ